VQAQVLANYLKNEYPQTVAVVLSKIAAEHAARVLSLLPEEFALDVVQRMLAMDSVQRDVLDKVEQTLRREFISNLSQTRKRDAHEQMAEIFNSFDRQTETRFIGALEQADRDAADRIKTLMFTFDDLLKLDRMGAQSLLRKVPRDVVALAIKGAADNVRSFFFGNMSERMGKLIREDIEGLGPVRLRDVDEAQTKMILAAKEMAAKGEIVIAKGGGEEMLI
jgi:flagellar motor switch protein FliG